MMLYGAIVKVSVEVWKQVWKCGGPHDALKGDSAGVFDV